MNGTVGKRRRRPMLNVQGRSLARVVRPLIPAHSVDPKLDKRAKEMTAEALPPAPQPSSSDEDTAAWVCCYVSPIEVEAHVVKGFLQHYGIPCVIRADRFSFHPLTFCAFGNIEILVPADWTKVAHGLIAGRRQGRRSSRMPQAGLRAIEGRQHG